MMGTQLRPRESFDQIDREAAILQGSMIEKTHADLLNGTSVQPEDPPVMENDLSFGSKNRLVADNLLEKLKEASFHVIQDVERTAAPGSRRERLFRTLDEKDPVRSFDKN